jgi:Protein of unknown function (DUF4242)
MPTDEPVHGPSLSTASPRWKYGNPADARRAVPAYLRSIEINWADRPAKGVTPMQLYVILRRNGWASAEDLAIAGARSATEGDKSDSGVRWIRSYALAEESGEVGTVCIYQADSPEAIRAHAAASDLPVDEIIPVADTVLVRPDPVTSAA